MFSSWKQTWMVWRNHSFLFSVLLFTNLNSKSRGVNLLYQVCYDTICYRPVTWKLQFCNLMFYSKATLVSKATISFNLRNCEFGSSFQGGKVGDDLPGYWRGGRREWGQGLTSMPEVFRWQWRRVPLCDLDLRTFYTISGLQVQYVTGLFSQIFEIHTWCLQAIPAVPTPYQLVNWLIFHWMAR